MDIYGIFFLKIATLKFGISNLYLILKIPTLILEFPIFKIKVGNFKIQVGNSKIKVGIRLKLTFPRNSNFKVGFSEIKVGSSNL